MADDVRGGADQSDGTKPLIRTDDVGGVHYPISKLDFGDAGASAPVTASTPLPVGGTLVGALTETAPATDIASSGLNGRLQRIAQRLSSIIALLPTALGASGGLKIEGVGSGYTPSGGVLTIQGNSPNGNVGISGNEVGPSVVAVGVELPYKYGGGSSNPMGVAPFGMTGLATLEAKRTANVVKRFSALGSGAEVTVWTPTASKRFRLLGLLITSSVAGDIDFRDNTAGTIILTVPVLAGAPVPVNLGDLGILAAAVNNVLTADAPGAGTLSGFVAGVEE